MSLVGNEAQVVDLRRTGKSMPCIARQFGVSVSAVYQFLQRRGAGEPLGRSPHMQRARLLAHADRIETMFRSGKSQQLIADRLGFGVVAVTRLLRARGVTRFDGGRHVSAQKWRDLQASERAARALTKQARSVAC